MRQEKVITISYTSADDDVKIQDISGVPREARIISITCNDATDSLLQVHIGLLTSAVFLLQAGTTGGQFSTVLQAHGHPVRWGSGDNDQLFISGGSAVAQGSLTFVTDNYGS